MQEENETVNILRELLKWTVVTSYGQVKATLGAALARQDERLVYHLSDGTRSGLAISAETGVNNAVISGLHSTWTKMGLMRKAKDGYQKLFNLEDFGLDIPSAAAVKAEKESRRRKA